MTQDKAMILVGIFFAFFPALGYGSLQCGMVNDVNQTTLMIGEAAASGLTIHSSRNLTKLQVVNCTCDSNDDAEIIFNDNSVSEFPDDWENAEVLRISGCKKLRATLTYNQGIANSMDGKLFIIDNVQELKVPQFDVGIPPYTDTIGTFSSVYFRNVTFYSFPSYFYFGDKYEVLFQNVSVETTTQFKFVFDNNDEAIDPLMRIEDSKFNGIDDINLLTGSKVITIEAKSNHKEDGSKCNHDYKGKLILARNHFGYLNMKDIFIDGGGEFHFVNNTIDLINEFALDVRNVKNVTFYGNNFGFVARDPFLILEYDKYVSGSSCSSADLKPPTINVTFASNIFANFLTSYVRIDDPDNDFPGQFIEKRFNISGNGIMKPCDCDHFEEFDDATFSDKFAKAFINSSLCFTDHKPPVFGNRTLICNGSKLEDLIEMQDRFSKQVTMLNETLQDLTRNYTDETEYLKVTELELRYQEKKALKSNWSIYLTVAVFISMIVAIIATIIAVKSCCS